MSLDDGGIDLFWFKCSDCKHIWSSLTRHANCPKCGSKRIEGTSPPEGES